MDSFKGFIKQTGLHIKSEPVHTSEDTSSLENIFGHFPALKEIDDYMISEALKRSEGNQGIAASLLGITRQALNQRLKKKSKSS
jgi:DNA-binding protein Fis